MVYLFDGSAVSSDQLEPFHPMLLFVVCGELGGCVAPGPKKPPHVLPEEVVPLPPSVIPARGSAVPDVQLVPS